MLIKLTKAIEILAERSRIRDPLRDPDYELALSLGIAALKAIHFARHGGSWHPYVIIKALLPGEQPEEIEKGG